MNTVYLMVFWLNLKKPRCNACHSYNYADTDSTSVQSPLKCFITKISESKDLPVLLLYQAVDNSKPLYFKSNKE